MTTRKFIRRIFRVFGKRRIKSLRLRRRSSREKIWEYGSTVAGRHRPQDRPLYRESFAAFGPSAFDNVPAGPGTHPFQKTVGADPADIAGLKCSFHKNNFSLDKGKLYLNHRHVFLSSHIYRSILSQGRGRPSDYIFGREDERLALAAGEERPGRPDWSERACQAEGGTLGSLRVER